MSSPRPPSTTPISIDITDADFELAEGSRHDQQRSHVVTLASPPIPTRHTVTVYSTTAFDVVFKVRSSNPAVISCTPASGVIMPFESVVLMVEVHSFAIRHHDGLYRVLNLRAENPRVKVSATRRVTQHPSRSSNNSFDKIASAFNVILAPFGNPQIIELEDTASEAPRRPHDEGASTVRRRQLPTPRKSADMEMEPYFGRPVASSEVSSSGTSGLQPYHHQQPQRQRQQQSPQQRRSTRDGALESSPQPVTPPTSRTAVVGGPPVAKLTQLQPVEAVLPLSPPPEQSPMIDWRNAQSQRVHVVVRPRPMTTCEDGPHNEQLWSQTPTSMGDEERTYFFDSVLSSDASNRRVHELSGIHSLMEGATRGVNACILLYGQTNSGKTHTLFGSFVDSSTNATDHIDRNRNNEPGLLYYALHSLFRFLRPADGDMCALSLFEVYNEEVRDLFADPQLVGGTASDLSGVPRMRKAQVLFNPVTDGFSIEGLSETSFSDLSSGLALISVGLSRVTLGASHINDRSSRAHTICKVRVLKRNPDSKAGEAASSEIFFVDLAGSESLAGLQQNQTTLDAEVSELVLSSISGSAAASKTTTAWAEDFARVKSQHHISRASTAKRETANINLSLTSLKKCMLELSRHQRLHAQPQRNGSAGASDPFRKSSSLAASHPAGRKSGSFVNGFVPYRDSVLTKILKSSLSGNSCVLMICTVSLGFGNYRETKATLAFGTLAKSVTTSAVANTESTMVSRLAPEHVKALEAENISLKGQIANLEAIIMAHTREVSMGSVLRGGLLTDGSAARASPPQLASTATSVARPGLPANVSVSHLEAFEASETRLGTLVADTIKYLVDGVSALVLTSQSTCFPIALRGPPQQQPPLSARGAKSNRPQAGGQQHATYTRALSATTTPRPLSTANTQRPVVRKVSLRLKLPQGRCGAEIVVNDGAKQFRVKLEDISRVILGKNFSELRAAAAKEQQGNEHDGPPTSAGFFLGSENGQSTKVLASISLFPFVERSKATHSSSKDPLLTFLCFEASDVEAWMISLAHISSLPAITNSASSVVVRSTNVFSFLSSADSNPRFVAAPATTSRGARPAGSPAAAVRRASIHFSWDINTIARRFPYAVKPQPSRVVRGQPSFLVLPTNQIPHDSADGHSADGGVVPHDIDLILAQLSEKELMLCKQHNIDLADYLQTRSHVLGDTNAGPSRLSVLISLYDIRLSCPVNLYQAFVIVKFLRDQRRVLDFHAFLSSGNGESMQ